MEVVGGKCWQQEKGATRLGAESCNLNSGKYHLTAAGV